MPRVVKIAPKDVYVLIEMGIGELKKISEALSLCRIEFDGEVPVEKESVKYLTEEFFPFVNEIIEGVERDGS